MFQGPDITTGSRVPCWLHSVSYGPLRQVLINPFYTVNVILYKNTADWIRIQSGQWIRIWIRIRNPDPDPDPGGQKLPTKVEKI